MSEVGEGALVMATCKCRVTGTNLVMTRQYLNDLTEAKSRVARTQAINDVIELLQTHQNLWFSQSLNIGSGAFWANKASTTQALITEIRKLNV
jgi:hypothetical protein